MYFHADIDPCARAPSRHTIHQYPAWRFFSHRHPTLTHLRGRYLVGLLALCLHSMVAFALPTPAPDPQLRALVRAAVNESDSFHDRFDAEVWLTDMSQRLASKIPDPRQRLSILRQVHYEATRAGLPAELVLAVIDVESNFRRFAISPVGARGLMQIMPFWLKEIGRPKANLFNTRTNLRIGCTILKYYLDQEHGDLRKALARYNGSYGNPHYPDRVFLLLSSRWFQQ